MKLKHTLLAAALAAASLSAQANLNAVGPPNLPSPPGHGFPLWYQDESGTVLDLCLPNASDTGAQQDACLLTGIGINPPYIFPGNFPDESFYLRAVADPLDTSGANNPPGTKRAIIVLALEAAFATGSPAVGQQIVFTRIRVTAGVPENGDYTVTHPYGVEVFNNVTAASQGSRDIVFSEDVGVAPGDFTGALASRVGPFLSAADANGNPLLPVTINGAQFLSDGVTPVPVTGSPFNTNYVLICGKRSIGTDIDLGDFKPDGSLDAADGTCVRTDLFALTGRLHNNIASPIPAPFKFTSLTYDRDSVNGTHMDGYVSVGRLLSISPLPVITLAGTNLSPVKMAGPDALKRYYAQDVVVPNGDLPNAVFAINSADVPPSMIQGKALDVVTVLSANYDPGKNIMIVDATSSDKGFGASLPPNLTLLGYPEIPGTAISETTDPADLRFTVSNAVLGTDLPPDTVTVQSEVGGSGTLKLDKGLAARFSAPGVPFAQDDSTSVEAGSTAVTIAVTANDIVNSAAPILANSLVLVVPPPPATGTATVNGNSINFTPSAATGPVTIKYTVSNAIGISGISNTATLTVDVTAPPGGPVPIANPDGVTPVINVSVNQPVTIDVLANDSGNGGTLDPASIVISNVTGGTASANATTGAVTFTAGATAGVFGFDYTVKNTVATGGKVSPLAHVRVTVVSPEQITFAAGAVVCRTRTNEWIINGTSTVLTNNTITAYATTLVPANPTAAQTISSGNVGVGGAFLIRVRPGPTCIPRISFKSSLGTKSENVAVTLRQ